MGHVRDRWMTVNPDTGRKVRNERWGKGQRWQARWSELGTERVKAFPSKDAAEQHLARVALGEPVVTHTRLTFGDYAEEWRRQRLHHRGTTATSAEGIFRRMLLPPLGHLALASVTRNDVQKTVAGWSERYEPSTVRVAYGYLRSVFKHAVDDRLLTFNPCARINLPALPREKVVPLTVDQVQQIAGSVPPHYRGMVILGAATGLRGGELRGLQADRVVDGVLNVDRQLLSVVDGKPVFGPPKSDAGIRKVTVGQVGLTALERHMAEFPPGVAGLVFTNGRGAPMTGSNLSWVWQKATEGMGLPDRSGFHALRHYHASILVSSGLSPRAVAERMGHADPAVLLRTYAHLMPSDEQRAVRVTDDALQGVRG
jgi:integrase